MVMSTECQPGAAATPLDRQRWQQQQQQQQCSAVAAASWLAQQPARGLTGSLLPPLLPLDDGLAAMLAGPQPAGAAGGSDGLLDSLDAFALGPPLPEPAGGGLALPSGGADAHSDLLTGSGGSCELGSSPSAAETPTFYGGAGGPLPPAFMPPLPPATFAPVAGEVPAVMPHGQLPPQAAEQPPRRKRGRPRLYDMAPSTGTTDGATADGGGASAAAASAAEDAAAAAAPEPPKKRGRGPKPKYVFATQQEALGARRERNRKAALESYYRKKEHTCSLEAEQERVAAENAALEALLAEMEATGKCPLLEATEAALDIYLASHVGK